MKHIKTIIELEALYQPTPALASTAKVADHITPAYATMIQLSPFVALATSGPEGLDCSPRGDAGQVVRVIDEKTLAMPDRRGNNRIDTLRNILADPRIALLFLLPGSGTTFRVNGTALLTTDEAMLKSFEMDGKLPRCVIVITVEAAYFQCARAIKRADLWNPAKHIPQDALPSIGTILQDMSKNAIDAQKYDEDWPARAAKTMW